MVVSVVWVGVHEKLTFIEGEDTTNVLNKNNVCNLEMLVTCQIASQRISVVTLAVVRK
jgi:hypothetical protein